MPFIGRENELKRLGKLYASDGYEGILVYGRRQIGKSSLLLESVRGQKCPVIYFEATEASEQRNISLLSETLSQVFSIPVPNFSTIEDAFTFLFEKSLTSKIIFILDEYPYLRKETEACDSRLQRLIDRYKSSSHLKLILCGSAIHIMEHLLDESNPLYKRLGTTIVVHQMDYLTSSLFYPNFTNEQKVMIYAVFGGVPLYNCRIDDSLTVKDNLISLTIAQDAWFKDEPENNLRRELKSLSNASEVFLSIAKGKSKFSDILSSSHVSSSPALADILDKLIEMDVVKKENPINDWTNKKTLYSISDPLSSFYYRYLFSRKSYLRVMPPESFFEKFIRDDFEKEYVPHYFEEISKQFLRIQNQKGKIDPPLYEIGKYYYDNPKEHKNGEFDIVTHSEDGYDFYEVKFTKKPIDNDIVKREKSQLDALGIPYHRMGFISRSGFGISHPEEFILYTLNDLYSRDE